MKDFQFIKNFFYIAIDKKLYIYAMNLILLLYIRSIRPLDLMYSRAIPIGLTFFNLIDYFIVILYYVLLGIFCTIIT